MATVFKYKGFIALFLAIWLLSFFSFISYFTHYNTILFFHIGPSNNVKFIGFIIDDWNKYSLLMLFTILTQTLKILADEIISPWIINTIMDDKYIVSYSSNFYYKSQLICQIYYLFSAIVNFFLISISISQIDFVLAFVITDISISIYTTHIYLLSKKNDDYLILP